MARKDGSEYNSRPRTFAKVLDEIKEDKEHIFCERLISYFTQCLATENEPALIEKFKSTIKKLEDSRTISDSDIALIFGVKTSTVNRWHSYAAPTLPPLETPVKLAEIFGVTTDYILGYAELPKKDAQLSFMPFKELGFTFEAYCNLSKIRRDNPNRYQEYMRALNIILEQSDYRTGYKADTQTLIKRATNPILEALADFFQEKYPNANCWITTTDPSVLVDMMEREIKSENYDPTLHVPAISAYHAVLEKMQPCSPDMYDAYVISQLTQELQWLKGTMYGYYATPEVTVEDSDENGVE